MGDLDDWLILLAEQLEDGLGSKPGGSGLRVAIGTSADDQGNEAGLMLTIVALRPAPVARSLPSRSRRGQAAQAGPPLALEAELMLAARRGPGGYGEGLRALSRAMRWLNSNPVLAAPAPQDGSIAIEAVSAPLEQHLALRAAYPVDGMPFALYRLRGTVSGS